MCTLVLFALLLAGGGTIAQSAPNLIENGGFESGLAGWNTPWSRSNACEARVVTEEKHGGERAVRVEHRGPLDWSFPQTQRRKVVSGEIYELSGWLRLQGAGSAVLCVALFDAGGQSVDWSYGGREIGATDKWQEIRTRFIIPPNVVEMWPRLIGNESSTVWLDDVALARSGSLQELRVAGLTPKLSVENATARMTFATADATLTIVDRRNGQTWQQRPTTSLVVLNA